MKFTYKRLLSLAVVLVMVLSMIPATSLAASVDTITCAHCTGAQTWEEYTGQEIETGKHYYFSAETTLAATIVVAEGQTVCFELNGQNVTTAAGQQVFKNSGTLHIQNSKETGAVMGNSDVDADANGGVILSEKGTLSLKDVKLQNGYTSWNGGILAIRGGTAIVNGGEISGGKTSGNNGGNIYVSNKSTTEVSATFTDVNIANGSATKSGKFGGNVYVEGAGAQATFTDCTFTGGTASEGGSVLATAGGVLDLNNCTINDATSGKAVVARSNSTGTTIGVVNVNGCTFDAITSEKFGTNKGSKATKYGEVNIKLAGNANYTDVELSVGVTVDLNGKTLTATSVDTTTGGRIIDSVGTGKLATNAYAAGSEQGQLPIAVDDGYVFENVTVAQKLEKVNDNEAAYKFYFSKNDAQTFLKEAADNEDATVKIVINYDGLDEALKYTIGAQDLKTYANNWDVNMFTLTISGINGKTNLTCGVEVTSSEVDFAITPATVAE